MGNESNHSQSARRFRDGYAEGAWALYRAVSNGADPDDVAQWIKDVERWRHTGGNDPPPAPPSGVEEDTNLADLSPVAPRGNHFAQIHDSEVDRLADDFIVLNLTWTVTRGKHVDRVAKMQITLRHSDPLRERVGHHYLKMVREAVGKLNVKDSKELHGIECEIQVNADGQVLSVSKLGSRKKK